MDRRLDEQARPGRAELALSVEDRVDRALGGAVEVGVGEDDVRRLAAEFHGDALDRAGRGAEDRLARLRLARERNLVDAGVLGHGAADEGAGTGNDVERPGWQARLGHQLPEHQRGQRRHRGRLQNDGVAERQRRSNLPHGLEEREVPRGDRADDTDRLAQRQQEGVLTAGERVAIELVGIFAEVRKALGRGRHVDLGGLEDGLAVVLGLDLAEVVGAGEQELRRAHEDAAALSRLHRGPRAALEGPARGGDRPLQVVLARLRDLGERLSGRRIQCRKSPAAGGRDELPVDEEVGLQELFPLEPGNALLLVGGDAFLRVLALEEKLLELPLDGERGLEGQVPA